MPTGLPPREDTYFIDPEDATEMERLLLQGRLISQNMDSLLPIATTLSREVGSNHPRRSYFPL